tara:strand:- start:221 stop:484 length:264 start_codon:yes stop_codon:yes gene_type:complete
LKITIGMPEILLLGSIYLYQETLTFSMVLLGMSLFGKLLSYGNDIQQKKQSAEAGKELTQNIMDSLMNAVTLSGIANGTKSKKNGYH